MLNCLKFTALKEKSVLEVLTGEVKKHKKSYSSFHRCFNSFSSTVDKSGISSSSMVHPSKTQSTSVAMQSTTLKNGNNHDNVYTNVSCNLGKLFWLKRFHCFIKVKLL